MDSPDCLLLLISISVFYFLIFFLFLHFLVVGAVRWTKLTHVGFRAHVKIASRIVSYRIVLSRYKKSLFYTVVLLYSGGTKINYIQLGPLRCLHKPEGGNVYEMSI